jgi:DNA polymerase-3 subunit delta'
LKNPFIDLSVWFEAFSNENKTGKTGYIYTQEIESLNKKLLLKHYESEFRVVLIWLPENMQASTSNKLLKLLEEPPKKTIFLLVSENSDLILKTIISRVQIIKIPNYNSIEIESFLNSKFPSRSGEEIKKMISLTGGNTALSVQMLQNDSFENKNFEEYQNWMRLCYSSNIIDTTKWVNQRSAKGRRNHSIFLLYSLKMIRNCLVFQLFDKNKLFITENEKIFLTKFHPFVHENNIIQITQLLEESIKNIERNANPKIVFYELSLQFMKLLKVNRKFVEIN